MNKDYTGLCKVVFFLTTFFAFSLGVGVYFSPLSEYGEFQVSPRFYLFFDIFLFFVFLLSLAFFLLDVFLRRRLDKVAFFALLFFIVVTLFSFGGLFHWGAKEYVHYFLRNQAYYFLFGVFFYLILLKIERDVVYSFLFKMFLLQVVVSFLLFFLELWVGGERFLWEGDRLTGTMINHNTFGFVMVFYCYWFYSSYSGKFKWLFFLISVALLVLSGSVTAIAGVSILLLIRFWTFMTLFVMVLFSYFLFWEWVSNLHFFWKLNQLFFESNTHLSSLSARADQFQMFINAFSNPNNWLYGVHENSTYIRLDSQYYNIFLNMGLLPLVSFVIFSLVIIYSFRRSVYFFYYSWFFVVACGMTAFLSRPNAILLFFLFLGASKLSVKPTQSA